MIGIGAIHIDNWVSWPPPEHPNKAIAALEKRRDEATRRLQNLTVDAQHHEEGLRQIKQDRAEIDLELAQIEAAIAALERAEGERG